MMTSSLSLLLIEHNVGQPDSLRWNSDRCDPTIVLRVPSQFIIYPLLLRGEKKTDCYPSILFCGQQFLCLLQATVTPPPPSPHLPQPHISGHQLILLILCVYVRERERKRGHVEWSRGEETSRLEMCIGCHLKWNQILLCVPFPFYTMS